MLNAGWENENRDANVGVFETSENVLLDVIKGVVGMKVDKKNRNAWWMEEVEEVV